MNDSVVILCDVVAEIVPQLDPETRQRARVIRTSRTEERAPISRELRVAVYMRDYFRCVWCGSDGRLELDHIVPWSAGGSDDFDNLRTLCHNCNDYRSNYITPLDEGCRRIPSGWACVYCAYDAIAGDSDLTAIYCRTCRQKAAGLPGTVRPVREWTWDEEIA